MQKTSSARSLASPSQIEPTTLGFDLVKGANLEALASIVLGYSKQKSPESVALQHFQGFFHALAQFVKTAFNRIWHHLSGGKGGGKNQERRTSAAPSCGAPCSTQIYIYIL